MGEVSPPRPLPLLLQPGGRRRVRRLVLLPPLPPLLQPGHGRGLMCTPVSPPPASRRRVPFLRLGCSREIRPLILPPTSLRSFGQKARGQGKTAKSPTLSPSASTASGVILITQPFALRSSCTSCHHSSLSPSL